MVGSEVAIGVWEDPKVGRAQTLPPTDTGKELGSQTLGKTEEHDKDSGLGRRAPAPSLS